MPALDVTCTPRPNLFPLGADLIVTVVPNAHSHISVFTRLHTLAAVTLGFVQRSVIVSNALHHMAV